MIPYIKQLWVEALRSGNYKRGDERLSFIEDGVKCFCALGVLCDLAVREGVEVEVTVDGEGWGERYKFVKYDGEVGVLPLSVMEWAEVPVSSPVVSVTQTVEGDELGVDDTRMWDIGDMNDSGYTWEVIAEAIERCL